MTSNPRKASCRALALFHPFLHEGTVAWILLVLPLHPSSGRAEFLLVPTWTLLSSSSSYLVVLLLNQLHRSLSQDRLSILMKSSDTFLLKERAEHSPAVNILCFPLPTTCFSDFQYGLKKKEEKEAEEKAAMEQACEGSLTRPKKAIPRGCGDDEEDEESILDTVLKYLPGPLQDMLKK
ncbi:hypothetical protein GOODEAATRI_014310 [Goodea atripinnis]|uniref:Uncharacterized protein n=1 Tax=Goodea atripinnis TaxID=208336 RepID=A0ABV0NUF6_9TELE